VNQWAAVVRCQLHLPSNTSSSQAVQAVPEHGQLIQAEAL
jgi:hypothetical protein